MTRKPLLYLLAAMPLFGQVRLTNPAEIEQYLEQAVETTRIPGLAALVVDKEATVFDYAYGMQDAAGGKRMRTDTIFRIASMTKPVAATAIMMLVEEGKLSLDDPITKYIPEFGERGVIEDFHRADGSYRTRAPREPATIRHLLSHSSGLAYPFTSDVAYQLSQLENPPTPMPLLFDPGARWNYANGIAIACTVLERIEGKGLDVFLQERIFGPLGMLDTSYVVPAAKHSRVATVHRPDANGELIEEPNPAEIRSGVSGDGGLYSTAPDYAKFIRMVLNGGVTPDGTRLISERSLRIMGQNQLGDVKVSLQQEPQPNLARAFPQGAGRDGFGLGYQVTGQHDSLTRRAPGSLSWAGIYNTEFWIDPATGIGGVLLMQYLPFYDAEAIEALNGFERRVYEGLQAGQEGR
jgi:CubicO group peptidase (beta-lactamase class C family)